MPINTPIKPEPISKDQYHQLDHKVMGIVFDVHNELGRLYEELEKIDKNNGPADK